MINIRLATINDSAVILECIKGLASHVNQLDMVSTTENNIKSTIFGNSSHVLVFIAEDENKQTLGFALIFKTFSTFKVKTNYYIEDLFVLPKYRKMGAGLALFNYIKNYAKNNGAAKVEWYVNNANTDAIDFYGKIGAKKLDYKSIYYLELKS